MLALVLLVASAPAAEVTDMLGRRIVVPARIQRVVGGDPPVSYLLYTIDPGLLVGLNLPPDEQLRKVFRAETLARPVIGTFGEGQGGGFNPEAFMALHPELLVGWPPRGGRSKVAAMEERLASTGIPAAFLSLDTLDDYPRAYAFLGSLLGREARCAMLASHFRNQLAKLRAASQAIPAGQRVSVYLAEDRDGLMTAGADSVHTEALTLAGGLNVHRGNPANRRGKDRVSLEQVMLYNPDVIVAKDPEFFQGIYRDPRWANLRAVRTHRVYLAPRVPFSWLDSPPSFLRLLGAEWLAHALYPGRSHSRGDLAAEIQAFFSLYFGSRLPEQELRGILP